MHTLQVAFREDGAMLDSFIFRTDTPPPADTTAPVVTLLGVDPLVLLVGGVYVDPGASAADDVDGDISLDIVVGGDTVVTGAVDSFTVTYDVSDAAGNPAVQVTRTVEVVDPVVESVCPSVMVLGDLGGGVAARDDTQN